MTLLEKLYKIKEITKRVLIAIGALLIYYFIYYSITNSLGKDDLATKINDYKEQKFPSKVDSVCIYSIARNNRIQRLAKVDSSLANKIVKIIKFNGSMVRTKELGGLDIALFFYYQKKRFIVCMSYIKYYKEVQYTFVMDEATFEEHPNSYGSPLLSSTELFKLFEAN